MIKLDQLKLNNHKRNESYKMVKDFRNSQDLNNKLRIKKN